MGLDIKLTMPQFTTWQSNHLMFGSNILKSSGIYIHGTPNTKQKNQPIDPLAEYVEYIGVATNNFRTRMNKFYGTLINGYDHSLGSYNHTGAREALLEGLTYNDFSSSIAIIPDPTEAKMMERLLIYLYKEKHGRVPRFNDTSPKK